MNSLRDVVVLGADGMLGRAWVGLLAAHGATVRACTLPEYDLARPATLDALPLGPGTLVVNCAAWTDVDGAEAAEEAARSVNATGPGVLGGLCARLGASLVHFSTDYVFDGAAPDAYPTDAPAAPINAYGRTKAEGERAVLESGARTWIIRTSWLYAPWGKNFIRTIAALAAQRTELRVVDDQRGRPTSAEHLARTALALVLRAEPGVWHATDGGACTWYELACEVVRLRGAKCRVDPCTSEEFPRAARRPASSVLDITGTEGVLGPMIHWQESLASVVARLDVAGTLGRS